MLVSIRDFAFCDGTLSGGFAATDFRLRFVRVFDVVVPLRQTLPVPIDRLIRQSDITFTVKRVHASVKVAEQYIELHERLIPQSGAIKITSTGGVTVKYVENGQLLSHVLTSYIGATTTHAYHIQGGLLVDLPPEFGYVLEEDTGYVLTEIGDRILIE